MNTQDQQPEETGNDWIAFENYLRVLAILLREVADRIEQANLLFDKALTLTPGDLNDN